MAALPQRLRLGNELGKQIFAPGVATDANGEAFRTQTPNGDEIPIFCAGGCGEVVGYFRTKGASAASAGAGEQRCSKCKARDSIGSGLREAKLLLRSADELRVTVKPRRNLRWLRLAQVITVLAIVAGSILIASGRVTGIYLAGFGTLAWLVVWLALWCLGD
jgi:hypothetical protein